MRYFFFFTFLCTLFSCNRLEEKDMAILSAANESLEISNKIIENNSVDIYNSLQSNLSDPSKRTNTLKWQSYAEQIKGFTDSVIDNINSIRKKLLIESGGGFGRLPNATSYNKTQPVSKVFFIEKNGDALNKQLANYKQNLLLINEELTKQFEKTIIIYTKNYQLSSNTSNNFTTTYFKNINTLSAFVLLNKIENNIRIIENDFALFCLNKTDVIHCGFGNKELSTLVAQNSTVFKRGESIEITAGVGSFSVETQPEIVIANKNVEINEGSVGIYKSKVDGVLGKHTIPVSIEFTQPNGDKLKKSYQIEYTVVE